MLKKLLFCSAIFFFFNTVAWGFDAFEAPDALSGSFLQSKKIQGAGVVLKSEGRFAILKDHGIKWETTKPVQSIVVIEGGNICLDSERVPAGAALSMAPLMQALLSRNMQVLAEYFTVSLQEEGRLVLKAHDATVANVFSDIEIKGGRLAEQVILHNQQGDVTVIDFFDVREKAEVFSCEP